MKNMQQVIKRDGRKAKFDISKIKQSIAFATADLSVNPLELESALSHHLRDGMKTIDVQEVLIKESLRLSNIVTKDGVDLNRKNWSYVSARLLLQEMFKIVKTHRDGTKVYEYKSFFEHIKDFTKKGFYVDILSKYTESEIKEMEKAIDSSRDDRFDYAGLYTLSQSYLIKDNDKLNELPQESYAMISLFLASVEEQPNRLAVAKEIYEEISTGRISLATPLLMFTRRPILSYACCCVGFVRESLAKLMNRYYMTYHIL